MRQTWNAHALHCAGAGVPAPCRRQQCAECAASACRAPVSLAPRPVWGAGWALQPPSLCRLSFCFWLQCLRARRLKGARDVFLAGRSHERAAPGHSWLRPTSAPACAAARRHKQQAAQRVSKDMAGHIAGTLPPALTHSLPHTPKHAAIGHGHRASTVPSRAAAWLADEACRRARPASAGPGPIGPPISPPGPRASIAR